MSKIESPFLNHHVLVRTFSAGVHIGILVTKDETNVVLKDARRIWKWNGAFTLSEIAKTGIVKNGSRLSVVVPMIELTQAVELIPTSEAAQASFEVIHE